MTTWAEAYEQLAYYINDSLEDKPNGYQHVKDAVFYLVDITSDGQGTFIVTNVFDIVYHELYLWVYITPYYEAAVARTINLLNKFTVDNYEGDLTTFVNSINWDNECVPYYWALYSEDGGYDTSEWSICS